MSGQERRKLTRSEAGRLGGLQAAHVLGAEGVRQRGAKGGEVVVERYGRGHMLRLAYQRHGRLEDGNPPGSG